MVVVDYSINGLYQPDEYDTSDEQRRQHLQSLRDDATIDMAIGNFCPRLRRAVGFLSRHKVGPLQQRVYLSDFQSSTTLSSLPTDGSSSSMQPDPRYDRFILSLPYLSEELPTASGYSSIVRWSIIAQCNYPDRAPEVILLGMENLSPEQSEAPQRRLQRPQHLQRRHTQSYQIIQERYWQQYVTSDLFQMPCLIKWDKMSNDNSSSLQYCQLADQLYECYANFQLYKLKISLKSTPSMSQPPAQLVQAFTQYKQLTKCSKSTMVDVDTVTTNIKVELYTNLEGGTVIKDYEDRRSQVTPLVRIRAIISIVTSEPTVSALSISSEKDESKLLLHLASVTTTFPSGGSCNKNSTSPSNTNGSLNKKYVVRILNPKLSRTTHQGAMMIMMLDATTEQCLDTTMIDFVTYVRRVQHSAIRAFRSEEDIVSSVDNDDNSIQLLFEALNEVFCNSPFNDNCILDYHISNHNTATRNNTNFIRYLLVDGELMTEINSQLKYILTVEYNKEVYEQCQITEDKKETHLTKTKCVPVVRLRSIYDDENGDHYLNIGFPNITEADEDHDKYNNELALNIEIATVNGMRQLRQNSVIPVLTRYNKQWSPNDNYISSLLAPPPYPLP